MVKIQCCVCVNREDRHAPPVKKKRDDDEEEEEDLNDANYDEVCISIFACNRC